MDCRFSEQEIFTALDSGKITPKIKKCRVEFHEQGKRMLNKQFQLSKNCKPVNSYQVYQLHKLTDSERGNSLTIQGIINKNGVLGKVQPINSSCQNNIKQLFKK